MSVEFRVLGPLEVSVDGVLVPVPSGRARALLATLLLRPNRVVSVDELVDRLWGGAPPNPDRAKATLHMVVTRLRQALGAANRVRTSIDGYLVAIEPGELDLQRFRTLVAVGRLDEALGLWRGAPLSNVASDFLHRAEIPALLEERVEALERRIDADLEAGALSGLVAELRTLTRQHPLRERFWAQLMAVLYRTGQQADALLAHRAVSTLLADELGVDPGPELRALHQRILAGEPLESTPRTAVVPRQLPPDVASFSGRTEDIAALDALLTAGTSSAVVISAIAGSGGVGKTALAVHWAHRVRDRFPDGQLFVNMRGYDLERPMTVGEALAQTLRGLGVIPGEIPAEVAEQTNLYRSLTADRRVLVVLDNVSDPDQVRPLLPSTSTCLVVVTSRSSLRGLVVLNDARVHRLGALPPADAHVLLSRILGAGRVAAEPDATARLAKVCGYLPLALRIAAADLAAQPRTTVADYVAALDLGDTLEKLAVPGDPDAAVLTAFRGSYAALDDETRMVFRRLGLVPGANFTEHAAAVLGELPLARARRVVDHLVSAHLVEQHDDARYGLHDLVRLYARDQVLREDGEAVGAEALHRLDDWYLRMVDEAATILYPDSTRIPIAPTCVQLPEVEHDGHAGALTWLGAEKANLAAVVAQAAEQGVPRIAWQLVSGLSWYFYESREDALWLLCAEDGLRSALAEGDRTAEAAMRNTIGVHAYANGKLALAIESTSNVVEIYRELGNSALESGALMNLGVFHQALGDFDRSTDCFRRALENHRRLGSVGGQATALLNLGTVSMELARFEQAVDELVDAQVLYHRIDSLGGLMAVHANLGFVLLELGRPDEALAQQSLALDLSVRSGAPHRLVNALWNSAETLLQLDRVDEAERLVDESFLAIQGTANPLAESEARRLAGLVSLRGGDPLTAVAHGEASLAAAAECDYARGEVQARVVLSQAHLLLGDLPLAASHAERAVALAQEKNIQVRLGEALTSLAEVRLVEGAVDEAVELASSGVAVHRGTGQLMGESRSRDVLARCEQARR